MKKTADRFIDFLCTDRWRKVIALVLACGLYFYLRPMETREIAAPVRVVPPPSLLLSAPDQSVTLKITGSPKAVSEIRDNAVSAVIQVDENAGVSNGQITVQVEPKLFSLPSGVRITRITPEQLTLKAERCVSREIPVEAALDAQLPGGFEIVRTAAVPDKVWVTGPARSVDSLKKLFTEPLVVDLDTTFSRKVRVRGPENLKLGTDTIMVTVEIRKKEEITRSFPDLPVRYLFSPLHMQEYSARLSLPSPGSVTVILTGPPEQLNPLAAEKIIVCADLTGSSSWQKAEEGKLPLALHFEDGVPTGVRVKEIKPPYIRVRTAPEKKNK